jgi:hypothetical protein
MFLNNHYMNINALLTAGLLACFSLIACKKTEPSPNNNNPNNNNPGATFFSAKVDQSNFPTADIQFTKAKFVNATKMLQIIGQPNDQKETIVLSLMCINGKVNSVTDWTPGSYGFGAKTLDPINYIGSGEYNKWNGSGYEQWFADGANNEGTLIILANDGTKIKGTFSFKAAFKNANGSYNISNIKSISDGQFDLEIQNQ